MQGYRDPFCTIHVCPEEEEKMKQSNIEAKIQICENKKYIFASQLALTITEQKRGRELNSHTSSNVSLGRRRTSGRKRGREHLMQCCTLFINAYHILAIEKLSICSQERLFSPQDQACRTLSMASIALVSCLSVLHHLILPLPSACSASSHLSQEHSLFQASIEVLHQRHDGSYYKHQE